MSKDHTPMSAWGLKSPQGKWAIEQAKQHAGVVSMMHKKWSAEQVAGYRDADYAMLRENGSMSVSVNDHPLRIGHLQALVDAGAATREDNGPFIRFVMKTDTDSQIYFAGVSRR